MEKTINFGLNKPSPNDFYNIEDFNENAVIIDETLKSQEEAIKSTNRNIEKVDATVKMHDDSIKTLEEKCENEIVTTTDTTLRNSKAGGIRVIGIDGNSIQNGEPTTDNTQEIVSFGECVEMQQGGYNASTGQYVSSGYSVCSKNAFPCKENDDVVVTNDVAITCGISFFNDDVFISSSSAVTLGTSITVPSGVNKFKFTIAAENPITLETVGKITLTVNGKYVVPVTTRGKNLLDCSGLVTTTKNGVTFTPVYDKIGRLKYINVNGTASAEADFQVYGTLNLIGKEVIFSGCPSGGSYSTYRIQANRPTGSDSFTSDIGEGKNITPTSVMANIAIYIGSGITVSNLKFYPMIREASIGDSTYAPYTEHTEYIYLNEPPRKIGDVKDRIVEKDGLFEVERNIKQSTVIFKQSMTQNPKEISKEIRVSAPSNMLKGTKFLCNKGLFSDKGTWDNDTLYITGCSGVGSTQLSLRVPIDSTEDVEALIQYQLATPTFEPLDTESQKALRRLLAYVDVTYIGFDSTIPPSKIEVEYGTSKVGALSLETANKVDNLQITFDNMVNGNEVEY